MVSVSLLHSFILLLLTFGFGGALASPVPEDTNAYRLSQGLPLKKPLIPFNATRTAAKRQQPSGSPETGNYVVTYNNPSKRKRAGQIYVSPPSDVGILSITNDIDLAALIKTPGTGAFSGSTIQIYNDDTSSWRYLYTPSKLTTGPSGYDVSFIGRSTAFSYYRHSAAGVLSYDWVASNSQYNFTPQMYIGLYAGYTVIVGGYSSSDVSSLGVTNIEPITITFLPQSESNPCLGRKRC
ncbi:hypothetical protein I302_106335 [Kwoniella bestiolae CBS 10118]|uniref:Peptidase A1 domain-containing protein n=1 Tax=Kwoniella bestiolae CBS 10118 TaxID=1296100 RepID=A0A1B9G3M9_9TREE|nr:hypothetical protein I302_05459 [Kwoniella bestiolae CBS 10118]OCF25635.1 hypothetical protein I302_05459 [Kwoniella bestiolae CBS 10118]